MTKVTASILVLLGAASYGLLSTITKLAYQDGFTTADVVGSQMFFGCIGLWLASLPKIKMLFAIPNKVIVALLLSGAVSGFTGIFYYLSLQYLPASYAVVLLFQFTWMGTLLDWIYRKKQPNRYKWAALGLISVGTILALNNQMNLSADLSTWGIILGLLSACSYTLFINFSGHVATNYQSFIRSTWMVTGGTLLVFIVFPPSFLINGAIVDKLWVWGGILGVFGIIIPFYLYAKGVPRIGITAASILGAIELPVVVILAFFILHEPTSLTQWMGIIVMLMGIIVPLFSHLN